MTDAEQRAETPADAVARTRGRRILPPAWFFASLVAMCALHVLWPGAQWLHGPARWLGLLPAGLGTFLVLRGSRRFGEVGTTIKPFQVSSVLVQDGPFRFTRNPMYLGLVLADLGAAIMLGSLTPLVVPPLLALGLDRGFIRREEQMLAARFGPDYARYRERVRRWL